MGSVADVSHPGSQWGRVPPRSDLISGGSSSEVGAIDPEMESEMELALYLAPWVGPGPNTSFEALPTRDRLRSL